MERVIGLGGPFIRAKDPKALAAWYQKHLNIPFGEGTYAVWPFDEDKPVDKSRGFNIFSFFKEDSKYFDPTKKDHMINLVVKDLYGLIEVLRSEGVEIVGEPMTEEYGKFGWIMDPEGNKIELWEAV